MPARMACLAADAGLHRAKPPPSGPSRGRVSSSPSSAHNTRASGRLFSGRVTNESESEGDSEQDSDDLDGSEDDANRETSSRRLEDVIRKQRQRTHDRLGVGTKSAGGIRGRWGAAGARRKPRVFHKKRLRRHEEVSLPYRPRHSQPHPPPRTPIGQ